jgi:hypothetical protein
MAMAQTRALLERRGVPHSLPDFEAFWSDFHAYLELKHASGSTLEQVLAPASAQFQFDIQRWVTEGMPADVRPYRLGCPTSIQMMLSPEAREELASAFRVWTNSLKGLSKLVTRIQTAWQVREWTPVVQTSSMHREQLSVEGLL